MSMISVELALEGVEAAPDAPEADAARRPGESLAATLTDWWATHALEPFRAVPSTQRLSPLSFPMQLLGEKVSFGLRFDEHLLADLFEAYVVFGWSAIEVVEAHLADLADLYEPTKTFFRLTRNVIAVMVADALMRLEDQAVRFAKPRWIDARAQFDGWRRQLKQVGSDAVVFEDRDLGKELVVKCRDYALVRRQVLSLGEEIERRNAAATSPEKREEGSGWQMWLEIYAKPQRDLLPKLGELLARVAQTYGAAVLVADALPIEVTGLSATDLRNDVRVAQAAGKLAGAIHRRLNELITDLDAMVKGLDLAPTTGPLTSDVEPVRKGDLNGLKTLRVPTGGFDKWAIRFALGRSARGEQRLLADRDLLLALGENEFLVEPGSMDQVVLFRHIEALTAEQDFRRKSDEFWATVFNWVERLLAVFALVALSVGAIFSGGAAAPAFVAAVSLIGNAAIGVSVVVLLAHTIGGRLQEADQLDEQAREQLFRLGQKDPEALRDIGWALGRSRALRNELQTESLKGTLQTVVKLGNARRIKAFAVALELQRVIQSIDSSKKAFGPAERGEDERVSP